LLAFVWINPPDNYVRIRVDDDGQVSVDGVAVDVDSLESRLKRRRLWLTVWHRDPHADICIDKNRMLQTDPHLTFLPIVKSVENSGFLNPTVIIVKSVENSGFLNPTVIVEP